MPTTFASLLPDILTPSSTAPPYVADRSDDAIVRYFASLGFPLEQIFHRKTGQPLGWRQYLGMTAEGKRRRGFFVTPSDAWLGWHHHAGIILRFDWHKEAICRHYRCGDPQTRAWLVEATHLEWRSPLLRLPEDRGSIDITGWPERVAAMHPHRLFAMGNTEARARVLESLRQTITACERMTLESALPTCRKALAFARP